MVDDAHPVSSAPVMAIADAARTRIVAFVEPRACPFHMVVPLVVVRMCAQPQWTPQDVILARTYWDVEDQVVKEPAKLPGVTWAIVFE